ncbi:MAG: hypothetical protein HYY62_07330 [Deltaproteobacteria bacterium]|nr:hypothetical protein [Deltaproteobacteria bacterium]
MKALPPFLLFLFLFSSFSAQALPKFSLKEKKRCYVCHFNKNGGGPLNKEGKYYSQHRSFEGYKATLAKAAQPKPVEKALPKIIIAKKEESKKTEAPKKVPEVIEEKVSTRPEPEIKKEESLLDWTSLSADLLSAFLWSEKGSDPQSFYLMKAEPSVTVQVAKDFLTVFGYNFATPLLTAYGQYSWDKFYAQLGSFHVPMGLDLLDYNNVVATLIKENYDLALDTRDVGIEAGIRQDFYGRVAIMNGARAPRQRPTLRPTFDRDLGYVVDGGYNGLFFALPFQLGTSLLVERRIPPGLPVRGVPSDPATGGRVLTWILDMYGQFTYRDFNMMGEFTFGHNTPVQGDHSYGFYLRPSYNIFNYWSVSVRGELFSQDRNFLSDNRARLVLASEYQFSKYISLEPMFRLNTESGTVGSENNNDATVLLSMKF